MVYDKKSTTGTLPVAVLLKNKFRKNAILALLNPEQEGNKEQCSVDLNTSWLV